MIRRQEILGLPQDSREGCYHGRESLFPVRDGQTTYGIPANSGLSPVMSGILRRKSNTKEKARGVNQPRVLSYPPVMLRRAAVYHAPIESDRIGNGSSAPSTGNGPAVAPGGGGTILATASCTA